MVDVTHRLCQYTADGVTCSILASYGYLGQVILQWLPPCSTQNLDMLMVAAQDLMAFPRDR
jgi:hypothetical protein